MKSNNNVRWQDLRPTVCQVNSLNGDRTHLHKHYSQWKSQTQKRFYVNVNCCGTSAALALTTLPTKRVCRVLFDILKKICFAAFVLVCALKQTLAREATIKALQKYKECAQISDASKSRAFRCCTQTPARHRCAELDFLLCQSWYVAGVSDGIHPYDYDINVPHACVYVCVSICDFLQHTAIVAT